MIIAVVPALRAGARIGRTLAALRRQSRPLERIVVVCGDAADAAPEEPGRAPGDLQDQ